MCYYALWAIINKIDVMTLSEFNVKKGDISAFERFEGTKMVDGN